jgi:hypothetical protein
MPKPGWTLEVQRDTLARPYTSHGRTITEDVVRITWTAKRDEHWLPDAHYDEFVLAAAARPGRRHVLARVARSARRPHRLVGNPRRPDFHQRPQSPGRAAGHPARRGSRRGHNQ